MMHGTFREPQSSPFGTPHLTSPGRAAREAAVAVASAAFQVAEDVARRSLAASDSVHPYPTLQMDSLSRGPADLPPRDSYGYGSARGTYGSNSPQRYSGMSASGYSPRPRSPRASSPRGGRGGGGGGSSRSARPPIPEYGAGFESPSSELAAMEREALEIEYRKIEMEGRIREKRREMEMRSQGRRGGGGGRPADHSSTHSSGYESGGRGTGRDRSLEREVSEERRRTKRLTEELALRESEYRQLERKIHSRTEQRSGYSSSRSHSPPHSTSSSRSNPRRRRI